MASRFTGEEATFFYSFDLKPQRTTRQLIRSALPFFNLSKTRQAVGGSDHTTLVRLLTSWRISRNVFSGYFSCVSLQSQGCTVNSSLWISLSGLFEDARGMCVRTISEEGVSLEFEIAAKRRDVTLSAVKNAKSFSKFLKKWACNFYCFNFEIIDWLTTKVGLKYR